jgi:hypothetical protein
LAEIHFGLSQEQADDIVEAAQQLVRTGRRAQFIQFRPLDAGRPAPAPPAAAQRRQRFVTASSYDQVAPPPVSPAAAKLRPASPAGSPADSDGRLSTYEDVDSSAGSSGSSAYEEAQEAVPEPPEPEPEPELEPRGQRGARVASLLARAAASGLQIELADVAAALTATAGHGGRAWAALAQWQREQPGGGSVGGLQAWAMRRGPWLRHLNGGGGSVARHARGWWLYALQWARRQALREGLRPISDPERCTWRRLGLLVAHRSRYTALFKRGRRPQCLADWLPALSHAEALELERLERALPTLSVVKVPRSPFPAAPPRGADSHRGWDYSSGPSRRRRRRRSAAPARTPRRAGL